ncbi:LysM domain-containing protein [Salinibacillus kushneri]|uniref:LysM domain-containing protein n=1 Tax=Salinibacillus kushneri TaxID=237682 RepID=A0A1I0J2R6_9BACI|nr:peptidoglycan DD-metalloendopeptidase family protein [Salinibacillus kushneri]SEU04063.1 LysM domain-containing protein [Salinibacillus kushneri]
MATFIWPTDTKRITSHFRKSRKDHHGTDIAKPGYHEVYATADGKVTRSYRSSSYGECIMIEHKINGQTYESVYAHMRTSSRKVSAGDKVNKGQVIGVMGNTGDSTGQHLHFELHKGKWNINKSDAVDPLDYLEKDLTPEPEGSTYEIRKGDTFWDLEKRFDLEHGTLQKLNPGVDPNALKIGQEIKISKDTKDKDYNLDAIVPYPGHLIKRGSEGKDVKRIQRAVGVKADGIYGPKTEAAVKDYQKRHGLKVDGIVGPETWAVMF